MTYKPPNQGRDSKPGLLPEIFYGWWVVFASCIVMGYSSGIMAYSSTIFFRPVAESLGASRTLMSVAVSLGRVGGALEAPLVGYFIDKLGPRTPMRVGMALASTGLDSYHFEVCMCCIWPQLALYLTYCYSVFNSTQISTEGCRHFISIHRVEEKHILVHFTLVHCSGLELDLLLVANGLIMGIGRENLGCRHSIFPRVTPPFVM